MNRNNLLRSKGSAKINQTLIAIRYCRTLSNMSKIITKNWDILQINSELQRVFKEIPIIAFKRNKNIQEIIRGDDILNEKVLKQHLISKKDIMFHVTRKTLGCLQVINIKSFIIYQTNGKYNLFHKLNCKSSWIVYLMKCTLCKIQYDGKI